MTNEEYVKSLDTTTEYQQLVRDSENLNLLRKVYMRGGSFDLDMVAGFIFGPKEDAPDA